METTIELKNISKTFGKVVANKNASLTIHSGKILAILGENGSGKTTLMNMLAGIYYPDSGEILINGKEVSIKSPRDAFDYGIGMIHQHFKLVDVFTASQNIILGLNTGFFIKKKEINKKIVDLANKYGFSIDPNKKIYKMSVSEKQTVEIIKLLYRGVDTLILDEPTAVLTPQETEKLFAVLKEMKKDNKTIIIITHKLNEVMEISDEVAILQKGKITGIVKTKEATEDQLVNLMVGEHVYLNIERSLPQNKEKILEVKNLTCLNSDGAKVLNDVSFDCYTGEILGVAGVSGSGQKALLEAIAGLQKCERGSKIIFHDLSKAAQKELIGKSPKKIRKLGVSLAFVPEDRLGMGLVGDLGMTDNMLLRNYESGFGPFLHTKKSKQLAVQIKDEYKVLTPSIDTPIRKLSGGNVQKVLVGREIANAPKLLLTAYATRGLDINTSYAIYNILNKQKEKGVAVIYVGEDIDVLLALTDRIIVLCDGRLTGTLETRKTDKKTIGQLMSKVKGDNDNDQK